MKKSLLVLLALLWLLPAMATEDVSSIVDNADGVNNANVIENAVCTESPQANDNDKKNEKPPIFTKPKSRIA